MTSRYMREIPLRILHRKVGDEHVTLLQACYDNPIFHEEDAKDYRHSNGTEKASRTADHTVVETCPTPDGAKLSLDGHVASDYMHSLPPTSSHPRGHRGISYQGYRRNRCRLLLAGLCCMLVVLAVGMSLLLLLIGEYNLLPYCIVQFEPYRLIISLGFFSHGIVASLDATNKEQNRI